MMELAMSMFMLNSPGMAIAGLSALSICNDFLQHASWLLEHVVVVLVVLIEFIFVFFLIFVPLFFVQLQPIRPA